MQALMMKFWFPTFVQICCVNLDIYKPVEKSWLNIHLHYKFQISTIEFQNISLKLKQCQIDNNRCKSSWVAMMIRIILLLNCIKIMVWVISYNGRWSFLSQRIATMPIICLVQHARSKVKTFDVRFRLCILTLKYKHFHKR